MKIAFIQTYPIYHDFQMTASKWLNLENRDKWMPGILADEGYEVELWGIALESSQHKYQNEYFPSFPIHLFKVSKRHKKTKKDFSLNLVEYAKEFDADLYFLKGVDGGAGLTLLREYLLPAKKPFVFIIGGKFYNKYVPRANGIFYETPQQKQQLVHPGLAFIHKKVEEQKLALLPKSIDTNLFRPMDRIRKEYDIISAGRLISHYKNYDPLGKLSNRFNVALIGDGPLKEHLQSKYPNLKLLGHIPHTNMPEYLNKAHIFFHTGMRDFFPRVIPEAMAAGLPCVGFNDIISADVIPDDCGLRVDTHNFSNAIQQLLNQEEKVSNYSKNAREYVTNHFGMTSSREPMLTMIKQLNLGLQEEETYVN